MRISVLVVAAAMVFAAPAFAQVESPPPPQTAGSGVAEAPPTTEPTAPAATNEPAPAATEETAEAELVCRNVTARTESRLRSARVRVCKTQAEWDAQAVAGNRSN
ncbi:MAG: hypothetical protein R3C27_04935 [Hyphomonadaceae bacterium]